MAVDPSHMYSNEAERANLAVSSSPRLWLDVFALPEKSNMAVTPRSENPHNFSMTVRPLSLACGNGTEMLLILKKLCLTWLLPDIFLIHSPQKCPTILWAVNQWLKTVSATGARTNKDIYDDFKLKIKLVFTGLYKTCERFECKLRHCILSVEQPQSRLSPQYNIQLIAHYIITYCFLLSFSSGYLY